MIWGFFEGVALLLVVGRDFFGRKSREWVGFFPFGSGERMDGGPRGKGLLGLECGRIWDLLFPGFLWDLFFSGISRGLSHFISDPWMSFPWRRRIWELFFLGFFRGLSCFISNHHFHGVEEFGICFSQDLSGFVPFYFPSLDIIPTAQKFLGFAFPGIS